MKEQLIQSILSQIEQPKADLEHHLRVLLNEAIHKMDLVSKEELTRHQHALTQANERIDQLNEQISVLEHAISKNAQ
ncbi:accessory factor UbiK family protein [Acinetobacter pollinis]|uniref:Accessory factor UbiK family protein n=1 Tax=Acinetobacter pollinis TaxID=2605270 RepID=A0ABU6DV73_9GAMM|nr:accessory factor UbiK family protein [Acinetobacter pollinis]MEB5476782.1 accessory factor UbiK family protein [Acinetobacter pollinis]